MNTYLRNARVIVKGKNPVHHEMLSIRGSNIRCYILPDSLNLDALLINSVEEKEEKKKSLVKPVTRGGPGRGGRGGRGRGGRGRGGR